MWDTGKPGLARESGCPGLPHLLRTESPGAACEVGAGFPDSSLRPRSLGTKFHSPVCSLSTSLSLCLASAARAWCQVAQKFTGGIGNKLCGEWWRAGEKGGQGRGLALAERVAEPRLQMGGDAGARPSPANQAPRSVSLYSSALWRF